MLSKSCMKKISSQIKTIAFSMYTYDKLLQEKIQFHDFKLGKLTFKVVEAKNISITHLI